ncbi:MAG: Uma2 family endonuclease, partial [Planctomycetaceae bacterium]|nr:Uma2 family endonuclease [Planctomycetaceae bacterium]
MGNVQSEQYTAEEAYELLLESPAELVKGELIEMVRPGARHGIVCGEVTFLLKQWNKHAQLGKIATNDSGVVTERGPDTVRGPDIYFIQNRRLPDGAPTGWVEVVPDLCIEVLSPNDRWS